MAFLAALLPSLGAGSAAAGTAAGVTAGSVTAGSIASSLAASTAAALPSAVAAAAPTLAAGAAGTGLSASTILGLGSSLFSAAASKKTANDNARMLREQAKGENAVASQAAREERRQARYAGSRALAVAGASGAGASDVTVQNIIGDIAAEGEYRALQQLFNGQQRARVGKMEASNVSREGTASAAGAFLKGGSTMLNSGYGVDWLEKYG